MCSHKKGERIGVYEKSNGTQILKCSSMIDSFSINTEIPWSHEVKKKGRGQKYGYNSRTWTRNTHCLGIK